MSDLRTLEFQLAQVTSSLKKDPNNPSLFALEKKLKSLIELCQESDEETEEVAMKKEEPVVRKVELRAGERCEARHRDDNLWWEATVQSISPDQMECTVIFSGILESQNCTPPMVRPYLQAKKRSAPSEKPASKSSVEQKVEQASAKKRKHTLAEHHAKKDAEHAAKQQSWQTFQKKLTKK